MYYILYSCDDFTLVWDVLMDENHIVMKGGESRWLDTIGVGVGVGEGEGEGQGSCIEEESEGECNVMF